MVLYKKWSKFSSRALLRILRKHTTFSTFLSKWAFASNFFTCFELLQQWLRTCQGHPPCQIIPCGTHSFFLRACTPKSSKTNGFLKDFSTAYHKITFRRTSKTQDLVAPSPSAGPTCPRRSARAHLREPWARGPRTCGTCAQTIPRIGDISAWPSGRGQYRTQARLFCLYRTVASHSVLCVDSVAILAQGVFR